MSSKLLIVVIAILVIAAHGGIAIDILTKDKLPSPDEYGFHINSTHGQYITNEIAFYEGYLVLEDYYRVRILGRGDHHTDTLLLSGDKITITSRVEGE